MTRSTRLLADFIRGITATAPQADDEERIEWHSAQQQPDHRDSIVGDSEWAGNRTMMICVSRCKSDRPVLDL